MFDKIKEFVTKIPNLKIFDPRVPIEIQTDASQHGIGGCLLQEGQPVAFCSRSLSETETRYPQIDKEMLGICFSLNKFQHYIYERQVTVKTDHKPLVAICEKDFYKVSTRLQKLKLKLSEYNIKVEYLPGKLMIIADLLSRSFIQTSTTQEEKIVVHTVNLELPISDNTLGKLKEATEADKDLQMFYEFKFHGLPKNIPCVSSNNDKSCLKFSRKPTKEPIVQHERPNIPFYKVAADIFTYGSYDYLVLVDYYSNWIEIRRLKMKTAVELINKLKVIFAQFGIPKIFVSDNMPFNSIKFHEFAKQWEFEIVTSSPRYPQSNGLAERAVGICKAIIRKFSETGDDIYKALLEYRTTPLSGLKCSPSEMLQGRMLRTHLPCSADVLKKEVKIDNDRLEEKINKVAEYYNRQAKEREGFEEGHSVMLRKEKYWVPAEILKETRFPNSYIVRDENGN